MNQQITFPSLFPQLETERLSLKMVQMEDAKDLFDLRSSPEFMKYLGRDMMQDVSEAEEYIDRIKRGFQNKTGLSWKICYKNSNNFIGYCGFWEINYQHFKTEIGYGLNPLFQAKGFMTEALSSMTNYMFSEMNIHHIKADIDPLNISSRRVLEKVGFYRIGLAKENYFYNGRFMDSEYYGMIKNEIIL